MKSISKQVVIIGGGPAGLAAACRLKEYGVSEIIILEREAHLGGILRQCIHDGFGLVRFGESLSGPEYAHRFIEKILHYGIEFKINTTVLDISPDRIVTAVSRDGLVIYRADAVVLAMGCRERTRGALSIPGSRPAGVYTAGVAQAYINLKNIMIGKNAIILGSGDIGLIMARRLTLEGVKVHGVFEIKPYPNGLMRNIEQCLNDFDIPLYTNHTVTDIKGKDRIESVTVSRVDENSLPVPGSEKEYLCDTLILSVGLIPENELSRKASVLIDPCTGGPVVDDCFSTTVPGVFACGNVLHVHDLADYVSMEAELLANGVVSYLKGNHISPEIRITTGNGVLNAVPQLISGKRDTDVFFRVSKPQKNVTVSLIQDGKRIAAANFAKLLPAEMKKIRLLAASLISGKDIQVVTEDE